jgi:PAS domain S-box-containing protein
MVASHEREQRSETSSDRMIAAMQEGEARLNGIIQSAMDAIITVDERQDIVIFNPAAEQMFGRVADNVLGTPFAQFIPPRFREAHRAHIDRFGATGVTTRRMGAQSEIAGLRANGEEFPLEASISQVSVGGKKLFTVILRDITARTRAERELRESREHLRQLSASLQAVREEEKARIARELHDELGQALTGLKMDLAQLVTQLAPEQQGAIGQANAMKTLIESTVASVRRIATELRPLMLDDLGLLATIEWLVNDFSRRTGIAVDLTLPEVEFALGPELSTALFRVLQESLTNVARHAGADRVRITLSGTESDVQLTVEDNGKGIGASLESAPRTFGLIGMRERARMLGGELAVHSNPWAGTSIVMIVPRRTGAPEAPS